MIKLEFDNSYNLAQKIYKLGKLKNSLPDAWYPMSIWYHKQWDLARDLVREFGYNYIIDVIQWALKNGYYEKFSGYENFREIEKNYRENNKKILT